MTTAILASFQDAVGCTSYIPKTFFGYQTNPQTAAIELGQKSTHEVGQHAFAARTSHRTPQNKFASSAHSLRHSFASVVASASISLLAAFAICFASFEASTIQICACCSTTMNDQFKVHQPDVSIEAKATYHSIGFCTALSRCFPAST